jgi:hypothetical protein
MKKLSFLLGTVGGALAGYVLSNGKLRDELTKAKDATAAAKILGKHLAADGETVAKEVGTLAKEYKLDDKLAEGKKYIKEYYKTAKDEVKGLITTTGTDAKKKTITVAKKVVKNVKKAVKK